MSDNTGIVIDTPEGLAHFTMANVIARLRFETKTGMNSSRGSTLQFARQHYGIIASTKKKALALMEQKYLDTYGRAYGEKAEPVTRENDTRLFIDLNGGRVTCRRHLGGYGTHAVEANPKGEHMLDGRAVWVTPLDTLSVLTPGELAEYPAECEDCR